MMVRTKRGKPMRREMFIVECAKEEKSNGFKYGSEWTYGVGIETAEYIATTHANKKGRKFNYYSIIRMDGATRWNESLQTYTPFIVARVENGKIEYTPDWIAHTTVSTMVDGVKHSVTLA